MDRKLTGLFGIGATLCVVALGCKNVPLADGAGTPVAVQANFSALSVANGNTATITAQVVDNRQTPLVATITGAAAACTPATAADTGSITIAVDGTYDPVPAGISTRFVVTGTHVGRRCVTLSSSGASAASVAVTVN